MGTVVILLQKTLIKLCCLQSCEAEPASFIVSSFLSPLVAPEYPWEIAGMDFVTYFPISSKLRCVVILILVCHFRKIAHFVPCHKEITVEEAANLSIDNCYRLHGVPKVTISDEDTRFVGKYWQPFMKTLNAKLNMSTARHPQTKGFTERVHETNRILLRYNTHESGFDWFDLPMVTFYYNCCVIEASNHYPFEISY